MFTGFVNYQVNLTRQNRLGAEINRIRVTHSRKY